MHGQEARDASRTGSAERRGTATKVQKITKAKVQYIANCLNTDHNMHSRPQPTTIITRKPDMSDLPRERIIALWPG
jgi:hypothetical protein